GLPLLSEFWSARDIMPSWIASGDARISLREVVCEACRMNPGLCLDSNANLRDQIPAARPAETNRDGSEITPNRASWKDRAPLTNDLGRTYMRVRDALKMPLANHETNSV